MTGGRAPKARDVERTILGVPARIMRPRLVFIGVVCALVCLGLVMVYSASSVEALSEKGDAAYFIKRQLGFAAAGVVLAVIMATVDYGALAGRLRPVLLVVIVALLVATRVLGDETNGATRWIYIGPFGLQASEFAKIAVLLMASGIAEDYFGRHAIDELTFVKQVLVYIGLPVALVLAQPDMGSTIVIVFALLSMLVAAGVSGNLMGRAVGFLVACGAVVGMAVPYMRQRILTALNPWADAYGKGYQVVQGFLAFGSGGLFGVGLGMSRQKYSYLPEAHNDFIFAIIGEELGLVGAVAVVVAFAVLAREGLKIAHNAGDITGRLIATGATTLITTQFFLNVMGVLGMFPLSGKTLPFISYGGSSIWSCLMLVGLIVGVSRRSALPETVHDERRRAMSIATDERPTGVGVPHRRAERAATPLADARTPLRLVDGGAPRERADAGRRGGAAARGGAGRPAARVRRGQDGRTRIDLGPSAADRLRSQDGPVLRGRGGPRAER